MSRLYKHRSGRVTREPNPYSPELLNAKEREKNFSREIPQRIGPTDYRKFFMKLWTFIDKDPKNRNLSNVAITAGMGTDHYNAFCLYFGTQKEPIDQDSVAREIGVSASDDTLMELLKHAVHKVNKYINKVTKEEAQSNRQKDDAQTNIQITESRRKSNQTIAQAFLERGTKEQARLLDDCVYALHDYAIRQNIDWRELRKELEIPMGRNNKGYYLQEFFRKLTEETKINFRDRDVKVYFKQIKSSINKLIPDISFANNLKSYLERRGDSIGALAESLFQKEERQAMLKKAYALLQKGPDLDLKELAKEVSRKITPVTTDWKLILPKVKAYILADIFRTKPKA